MKSKLFFFILSWAIILISACSDISDTQREFLDEGESNYVGILDSVVVYGGNNRVDIVGKNTYIRNATQFVVEWVDMEGKRYSKEFPYEETIDGDSIRMSISPLEEGDYTFYVYSIDDWGNRSLSVEVVGSSYGEKYLSTQSPLSIIGFTLGDREGDFNLELSSLKDAVKCKVVYNDKDGVERILVSNNLSEKIVLHNWEDIDGAKVNITTYVVPIDKKGMDTLELAPIEQIIRREESKYNIDRTKCHWMQLTAYGDNGTALGAGGKDAIFDGRFGATSLEEFWGQVNKVPGHFCFDMGERKSINKVSIWGRSDYMGWSVVKFEVWGRESIEDGPGGDTGYEIQANDTPIEEFTSEAIRRGWKKVGDGWFKYPNPKQNPTEAVCELTNITPNFTPRYILFRVLTVLTPGIVGGAEMNYTGEDGGYNTLDQYGKGDYNISELLFSGEGVEYTIE